MLTDSFIVPTSLGNIDHPCPGKYLRYSDDLIEQYGTLDFRFSWNTYDESSLWESKSVWWGDRSEARDFRLTEGDWDLMVRVLFEGLVRIVQEESDNDDHCTSFVKSKLNHRMESVNEIRTILHWFDKITWHHLPLAKDSDPVLQQIRVSPRFIKFLIKQAGHALWHSKQLEHFLLPAQEMCLEDSFNLLKMQFPSKDGCYMPPSRILIEHEMKADQLLKQWEYRTQELIAD